MSALGPVVSGVPSLVGIVVGVLALVLILGIVGAFVVIVVANRADPDPTGRRPFVVYLFGVAFITLWTALMGAATVVSSLVQLIGSHTGISGGSIHPIGDATARGVVFGGLVLFASVATLVIHLRKGMALATIGEQPSSPAFRCAQSYVSAVAFVSVLVTIIAGVTAVYLIFQIVAPGVFGGTGRVPVLRHFLDASYVALAAGAILRSHLKLAKPQLWLWPRHAASESETSISSTNP